ncbi:MAG: chemotaxis protein [Ponticaulis sp.]|nr:chemotaxis protein [Ponticaulis sp.]|tara:strand:+ start:38449 stop:38751 length:303 start_codon:yes stop_codon:yes gene_type:complete
MNELDALAASSQSALPSVAGVKDKEAARKVAEEFEAMFLTQMLAPLFESLDTDGIAGGGSAERAFRPMLVDEYAKEMSKQGGIGLADQVYTEILRMQGLE